MEYSLRGVVMLLAGKGQARADGAREPRRGTAYDGWFDGGGARACA